MSLFDNSPPATAAATAQKAPSVAATLRRLFQILFLRGRSSRGLKKSAVPDSIAKKLGVTLLFYAFLGTFFTFLFRLPIFGYSAFLHVMTFGLLGLFVASSSGEVLFNKEEADILLHRPIDPKTLLWAKVTVLLQVSMWLALAYNLTAFVSGCFARDANLAWPAVHLLSLALEALFCVSFVVMIYELCLRWFGRERLDGLMTTAQVLMAVVAVVGSQLLPQLLFRSEKFGELERNVWWIALFPPAWFAGIDDAIAGSGQASSWMLAGLALAATAIVTWLAFSRLARSYESGLQRMIQAAPARVPKAGGRRWLEVLVDLPPMRWWLREPVSRAAFLLSAAYLTRDRDVKLRLYPTVAPMMGMPLIFFFGPSRRGPAADTAAGFMIPFAGCYVCLVPMMAIQILRYSQQWQAADVFRSSPLASPLPLCHGARRAVLCLVALPLIGIYAILAAIASRDISHVFLLLPGMIVLPIFALVPSLDGTGVPLICPVDESKAAKRTGLVFAATFLGMILSGITALMWSLGLFVWFILAELAVAIPIYISLRRRVSSLRWDALD
jgi:ABC-2 type transport system permease protein